MAPFRRSLFACLPRLVLYSLPADCGTLSSFAYIHSQVHVIRSLEILKSAPEKQISHRDPRGHQRASVLIYVRTEPWIAPRATTPNFEMQYVRAVSKVRKTFECWQRHNVLAWIALGAYYLRTSYCLMAWELRVQFRTGTDFWNQPAVALFVIQEDPWIERNRILQEHLHHTCVYFRRCYPSW